MKEYFSVNVSQYVEGKNFQVVRPASLNHPKNHAVMFIIEKYLEQVSAFKTVENCLIFWPEDVPVDEEILKRHAVFLCEKPHTRYCEFFKENHINALPPKEKMNLVDGAYIAETAIIGSDVTIMPGAYIGGECVIGDHVYIGVGSVLVGEVHIGNNVIIRENCVIGSDAATIDRTNTGEVVPMPQFGRVEIEDDVLIGVASIVARGAIDETKICRGVEIGQNVVIGHNTTIGENTLVLGKTIIAGSVTVGENSLISCNSTVRNVIQIGDRVLVGMGSVVTKSIPDDVTVKGNPAR